MSSFSSSVLSISEALNCGIIISGVKEYIYDKCIGCLHASFRVALGLNPRYGWYIQCCDSEKCSPLYSCNQLSLDF